MTDGIKLDLSIDPSHLPVTTASFRAVDQHTGDTAIAEMYDLVVAQRDHYAKERDAAIAERDNLVDLTIEVGRLGDYLRHAIADRDNYREEADEWRDKHHEAQCRMDEMAAEIADLKRGAK